MSFFSRITGAVRKVIKERNDLQQQWKRDVASGEGNYYESISDIKKRNAAKEKTFSRL